MRALLASLLLLLPVASWAATPEESYLAARDGYLKTFKEGGQSGDAEARLGLEKRALEDLEKQLRQILGPMAIKGMSGSGKFNIDTLTEGEMGLGRLDALAYASSDGKTNVVVTTEPLFKAWLKAHAAWWGDKAENVPQDDSAALQSEAFYTQALSEDAAVSKYADIPLAKPAHAQAAFAMLAARSQDSAPPSPDEIIVAVVSGGKVFVVTAPARVKVAPIAACDKARKDFQKRAEKAQAIYVASDLKNTQASDDRERLEREGEAAFKRCFAERAKTQASFAKVTEQAQRLMALVP